MRTHSVLPCLLEELPQINPRNASESAQTTNFELDRLSSMYMQMHGHVRLFNECVLDS